jgi:hypothetical protein
MLVVGICACAHDPEAAICPEAGPGDLVITELSGEESTTQWVELYNAGSEVDLEGAVLELLSIDGSVDLRLMVRRSLVVAGGDYVVLGMGGDADRPDHVDYGFGADFETDSDPASFPSSGGLWLTACAAEADDVPRFDMPPEGTLALGTDPPTEAANDDDASWCADPTGTPGESNPPCP